MTRSAPGDLRVSSTGHLPTLILATTAFFGTAPAVLGIMLGTLGATGFADFRAHPTDVVHELRTAAHQRCRHPADLSTIAIQANASRHHFDVLLAQAGVGAMFALLRTADTGFDARAMFLVAHSETPCEKNSYELAPESLWSEFHAAVWR